jgi:transposase
VSRTFPHFTFEEELAMSNVIMIGCDLHEDSLMLKMATGLEVAETRQWKNTARDRQRMVADLLKRAQKAGAARMVFVYEASAAGYGLYDQLTEAGVEAYVLAPTKIPSSTRQKKEKTDEKDALLLLNLVRSFVLAGNPLPTVWVPDAQTRDDRELVRTRLDVSNKIGLLKNQVKSLLKRNQVRHPTELGKSSWTRSYRAWLLAALIQPLHPAESPLHTGTRQALASLVRQLDFLEQEQERLDRAVSALVDTPRYLEAVRELTRLSGVGVLTALVFLTEMGDLARFANRRQVAAYLGLAPCCFESGRSNDRKGHITRQGSPRIRRVLCQAAWTSVRRDPVEKAAYTRIVERNPKKKKIAVVAAMRRLAVRMWHYGQRGRERQAILPGVFPSNSRPSPGVTVGFSEVSTGCPKGGKKRLGKRPAASRG